MLVKASDSNHAGSFRPRARRSLRLAIVAIGAYAVLACTLVVGSDELTQGCPSGTKRCDLDEDGDGVFEASCKPNDVPDYGCGNTDTTCRPCALEHAQSGCSGDGQCIVAACEGGYSDCTDDLGCETDIRSDVQNCGKCDESCTILPWNGVATFLCGNENCNIGSCESGRRNCDGIRTNGCECTSTFCCDDGECPCESVCCAETERCSNGTCVPD
jgi:hypothetical protein